MNSVYKEDVTLAEIKKILSEKAKEKELSFEQNEAYEHAKSFSKLSFANAQKLKQELMTQVELSDELSTKLVDILPNNVELDVILEKEKEISEEQKQKIIELIEKYNKEK